MSPEYELRWKRSALRELKDLPRRVQARILRAIEILPAQPRPPGTRKLTGSEHTFRIRIGAYRVIYSVLERELAVEVVRVRHRKDAYR